MKWIEQTDGPGSNWNEIFSFEEYMEQAAKRPKTFVRPTGLYFKDLFHHFGGDKKNGFQLFKRKYPGSIPICGQIKCQQKIYENLCQFL